jgi:hypothetical protein
MNYAESNENKELLKLLKDFPLIITQSAVFVHTAYES